MPGTNIEAYLEEFEEHINNASSPLSGKKGKKIIDKDVVYGFIDDIKRELPEELQKARRVLRERQDLLDSAEEEAKHIIQDAEDQANNIASEQEIVRLANRAAEEIRRQANEEAREIRYWAESCAEQVFSDVEEQLAAVIKDFSELLDQVTYYRNALRSGGEEPMLTDGEGSYDQPR